MLTFMVVTSNGRPIEISNKVYIVHFVIPEKA